MLYEQRSFCNNRDDIINLWELSLDKSKDTEMKARVESFQEQITNFDFPFYCLLGEEITEPTDTFCGTLHIPFKSNPTTAPPSLN